MLLNLLKRSYFLNHCHFLFQIMSRTRNYAEFLFQIADMGSQLEIPKLRECARQILKIMPPDQHTMETLRSICAEHSKKIADSTISPQLEALFFGPSPAQVLYSLEVNTSSENGKTSILPASAMVHVWHF